MAKFVRQFNNPHIITTVEELADIKYRCNRNIVELFPLCQDWELKNYL